MNRSLFSAALILLLATALAWGNCARCMDFVPVPAESHDCCDKDQAQKPAPMDCAGKFVDFSKATQPDHGKAPVVLAEAGEFVITLTTPPIQSEPVADAPPLAVGYSPLTTPLRI